MAIASTELPRSYLKTKIPSHVLAAKSNLAVESPHLRCSSVEIEVVHALDCGQVHF